IAPTSTSPPAGDDGGKLVMAVAGPVGVTTPAPTKARPPRSSSRPRNLRSQQAEAPAVGEEERRLEVDRNMARRALLNSAVRRGGSGGSDGGYSSGGGTGGWVRADGGHGSSSGGSVAGGGGSSAARRGSSASDGAAAAAAADGLSPGGEEGSADRLHERGFFSASPREGEGGESGGGGGGGVVRTVFPKPGGGSGGGSGSEMLSPLRSPMPRRQGSGGPSTAAATANVESGRPLAPAVATEEAYNPAYSSVWASWIGLGPSAPEARGGATNGATNGASASSNRVTRATNGAGGSREAAQQAEGAARNGSRAASPLGQMMM
ncbi:unnamed protein product, partial [Ectocarpus sp. 12 AP-2014]